MTISPDARTPSATVHALSGATPPGAGTTLQPFGVASAPAAVAEMPDTFVPLGAAAAGVVAGLAARRAMAHPDAAVIDLAGRVRRLAAWEDRVVLHTCRIEDAVCAAMRPDPRPELSKPKLRFSSQRSTEADGTRVTTIREPAGWDAESKALREAHEAALAARQRRENQEGERRNLPYWMKLRERAGNRLYRWILQLADMQPLTHAGLAAKAAAVDAIAEDGSETFPCDWHQKLAASLSRNVVRLARPAPVPAQVADPCADYSNEIMALQATIRAVDQDTPETEAAWGRWQEIDALVLRSRPTTLDGVIGMLEVAQREHHQFNIEDVAEENVGTDDKLIQHCLDSALAFLREVVDPDALGEHRPAFASAA